MSSWQVLSSSAGRLFLWSTLQGLSASPAPFPLKSPALSLGWVTSTVLSTPSFILFSMPSSGTSSAKSCTYSAEPTGTGRRSDQDFLYSSLNIYFCLWFAVFVGEEGRRSDGSYRMVVPSPLCPLQGVTGKYQWIQPGYSPLATAGVATFLTLGVWQAARDTTRQHGWFSEKLLLWMYLSGLLLAVTKQNHTTHHPQTCSRHTGELWILQLLWPRDSKTFTTSPLHGGRPTSCHLKVFHWGHQPALTASRLHGGRVI